MPDSITGSLNSAVDTDSERKLQRLDYVVIVLLFASALALRLYFYRFHDVISVDGTGYVGAARKLVNGDISALGYYGLYPVLTWVIGLAVPDMETAAQLVSVLMGSLLLVPLYLLGAMLFSRTTAVAACLVTMVWSSHLFVSCIVANQAAYTTLALTSIYLVWRMFGSRGYSQGCLAGFIMGLAFLTRTEAFLLFFVMPIAPLLEKRRVFHLIWRPFVGYCAVFAFILFMNLLLIHHFYGTWQLSAKTSSALGDTLSYYLKTSNLQQISGGNSIGYLELITKYPDLILNNPVKNLRAVFETTLPVILWLLALIGFIVGGRQGKRWIDHVFLLSSFAPLGVIIVFYYINSGYVEPFLPVLFLWCAEGAHSSERFLTGRSPLAIRQGFERFGRCAPAILAASVIYAIYLLVLQIPEKRDLSRYTFQDDEGRRDHKRIGKMLKTYLPPGKIMTRWARLAYYSEHEMVDIPNIDIGGIEKAAMKSGARFLVLDGRLNGPRPQLDFLVDPLYAGPETNFWITSGNAGRGSGLHRYLIYSNPSSIGVIVYEIVREVRDEKRSL